MKNLFLRTNDAFYNACIWISGLSLTAIALIIPWGIFARYVLGTGSRWPEPVAVLLVGVFTFLGAAAAYRANAHMAMALFTARLPASFGRASGVLIQLLMAIVSLFMLIWGINLCMATWGQFNSALPGLRVGMAYSPIPIGAAFTLSFVIERMLFGDQTERPIMQLDTHTPAAEGVE
ncbi:TRAP-type C4-dicarboxylate transport system, small permease component [plant metagenome]|uniref:TRAP-type C4-dicarboxylate transport system, small permease component n=1 Tax=plant metagenome TaxID=1297885 RepID=A0A484TUI6_9ZZZZ